ncbi:phage integrase N-terminal SAM-like domain-containing protein (plasmid) [Pseudoalteromonas espejiana]
MLVRQYSLRTVDTCLRWIASISIFIINAIPPQWETMVERYLEHLVLNQNVAPRTQSHCTQFIVLLYKHIIKTNFH